MAKTLQYATRQTAKKVTTRKTGDSLKDIFNILFLAALNDRRIHEIKKQGNKRVTGEKE
jgi:hypothetical protein